MVDLGGCYGFVMPKCFVLMPKCFVLNVQGVRMGSLWIINKICVLHFLLIDWTGGLKVGSAFILLALCWFITLIINLTELNFMQVVSRFPVKEQNVAIIVTQLWKLRSGNYSNFLAYYFHSFGWCFIEDSTLKWVIETPRNSSQDKNGYQISPSWFCLQLVFFSLSVSILYWTSVCFFLGIVLHVGL